MHVYLHPTHDTFISNQKDLLYKNFSMDEIVEVGANIQNYINQTSYTTVNVTDYTGSLNVLNFDGQCIGSISGTDTSISGSMSACDYTPSTDTGC